MKLDYSVTLNLEFEDMTEAVKQATRLAMRDMVVDIAHDAVGMSPVETGNNRRSIKYEASGFGAEVGIVDQSKTEGAVYSTSGYGGFLETGTAKMAARPYFKPALDRNSPRFPEKLRSRINELG